MTFDPPGFDDDLEPPPSTKRFDPRDLQAAARVSAHIEDDDEAVTRTLVISPEENARLCAEAFPDSAEILSLRDVDVDIFDDVTVEIRREAIAPAALDTSGLEPSTTRVVAAAWTLAAVSLAVAGHVFGFAGL